jgi:hypothetical protein
MTPCVAIPGVSREHRPVELGAVACPGQQAEIICRLAEKWVDVPTAPTPPGEQRQQHGVVARVES